MKDYLALYQEALHPLNLDKLASIVRELVTQRALLIRHPDRPDIVTSCCSGQINSLSNLLFFCDENGRNRWCLVQNLDFMEAAITDAGTRLIVREQPTGEVKHAEKKFREGAFSSYFERRDQFGGFLLSSGRPFHFFYDQLLHLSRFDDLPAERRELASGSYFFPPSRLGPWRQQPPLTDRYYLLPNVLGGHSLRSRRLLFETAKPMERHVESVTPHIPRPFAPGALVLWFGVTGQKRSWIEQVEGYAAIANEIARAGSPIGVYIDGMTATHGEQIEVQEDVLVASEICARLHPDVQVMSLIGRDFATKVGHCRHVNAFIANGGTGCMIPLRFCRKPGVVHSNSKMRPFAGDSYTNVRFVDPQHIRDVPGQDAVRTSYHIEWQHMFGLLVDVLREAGHQLYATTGGSKNGG